MLYINAEMKKILSDEGNQNFTGKVQSFLKEILDKTKILGNCVIYDDEGIDEADINWNIVSRFARDWTEYEVACNEFRLRKDEFRDNQYQSLAYEVHNMLKNKFPNRKFAVYICVNGNFIEIRFHTYRTREGFWLDEDLGQYSNPVLCLCDND